MDKNRGRWWLCKCKCGGKRLVRTDKLVHGLITCCESCKPRYKDMTGKRFGKLKVIEYAGPNYRGDATWRCICDCGRETIVQGQALRAGLTKSCGCYNSESKRTHGGTHERLYGIWQGIRGRCYRKKDKSYKYYGGRGVKVCDEWRHDYAVFREWALSNGYDPEAEFQGCTIDRIDPYGDYSPENCRWTDIVTQERNKRRSKHGKGDDA